ncbi:MAG: dihydrodipicolinate synthase family protein [Candidatus Dormibacteraceae bacterium]
MTAHDATDLRGVIPILVTPFSDNESVDHQQMARQIDFLVGCGVRWAGFGFGSEIATLTPQEAFELARFTVDHAAGRLRLIGNAEMPSRCAGAHAVEHIAESGVAAVMIRPSGFGDAQQSVISDALAEVVAGAPVPCIIQDAPQNTGVVLTASSLVRLLVEVPNVAAVKVEPRPSVPQIGAIVEELAGRPGTVLGGAGAAQLLLELDRGAVGTMPGPAFADLLVEICRQYDAGERPAAAELFRDFLPLAALGRGMATFLFAQKYLLTRRGVLDGVRLRSPHGPVDRRLPAELDSIVEAPALRRALAAGVDRGRPI